MRLFLILFGNISNLTNEEKTTFNNEILKVAKVWRTLICPNQTSPPFPVHSQIADFENFLPFGTAMVYWPTDLPPEAVVAGVLLPEVAKELHAAPAAEALLLLHLHLHLRLRRVEHGRHDQDDGEELQHGEGRKIYTGRFSRRENEF